MKGKKDLDCGHELKRCLLCLLACIARPLLGISLLLVTLIVLALCEEEGIGILGPHSLQVANVGEAMLDHLGIIVGASPGARGVGSGCLDGGLHLGYPTPP